MKPGVRCTVCTHPERVEVDRAIVKESVRGVAKRFDLSPGAVQRHKTTCQRNAILARQERVEAAKGAEATVDTVAALVRKALEYLEVSEVRDARGKLTRATDVKGAAATLRAAMGALQLQAQLRGEIKTGSTTNVLVDQRGRPTEEWAELTGVLFAALRPWPEASRAAAAALAGAASGAPSSALVLRGAEQGRNVAERGDVVEGEIV